MSVVALALFVYLTQPKLGVRIAALGKGASFLLRCVEIAAPESFPGLGEYLPYSSAGFRIAAPDEDGCPYYRRVGRAIVYRCSEFLQVGIRALHLGPWHGNIERLGDTQYANELSPERRSANLESAAPELPSIARRNSSA